MPVPTAAGDIVSYDIYYVSLPHVHDGQQYVINFHDHHSTINLPYYLLPRKSDEFRAIKGYVAYCTSHRFKVRRQHHWGPDFQFNSQIFTPARRATHYHFTARAAIERGLWTTVAHKGSRHAS
eukprot:1526616-Pleurochrysis_carterae.AAC.2